jgi:hypothetical protein
MLFVDGLNVAELLETDHESDYQTLCSARVAFAHTDSQVSSHKLKTPYCYHKVNSQPATRSRVAATALLSLADTYLSTQCLFSPNSLARSRFRSLSLSLSL